MAMIPAGYYKARAVRVKDDYGGEVWAKFGRASTGSQQVLMMFEILEGVHEGAKLPWFGFFTENAWERTIESLRYCGFQGDDLSTLGEQTLDQVVSVKVEHNTNKNSGQVYARVAFVNELGAGGVRLADAMTSDEVRDFAAMMKSKIAGRVRPPHAADTADDDLGF